MSEKTSKGRFLYDKPEKLQSHSNEEIGKEKEKSPEREGKEEKRNKAMVVLLVFITVSLVGELFDYSYRPALTSPTL